MMKPSRNVHIIVAFLLFAHQLANANELLIVLMRHGPRHPLKQYSNENSGGQLQSQGLRMSYQAGRYFSKQFEFMPKFSTRTSTVISSSEDRTRLSARAFMQGIYGQDSLNTEITDKRFYAPQWRDFDSDVSAKTPLPLGMSAMPISTYRFDESFMFETYSDRLCPKVGQHARNEESEGSQILLRYTHALFEELKLKGFDYQKEFGLNRIASLGDFDSVYEVIRSEEYLGRKHGLSDEDMQRMHMLYSVVEY